MRGFGRRDLLRAAGTSLCLPLWARQAFSSAALPPRLAILMWANGTSPVAFWPDAQLRSPILSPLLDDPALRPRTTLVRGVYLDAGGPGNEHDRGFSSFWTGVPSVGRPEESWGGGPSIDQQLKRRLRPAVPHPTLACGVLAAYQTQKNGHRMSFSYFDAARQVPTQTDPYKVYRALFAADGAGDSPEVAAARLRHRRSVLDHVAADLRLLAGRLPSAERDKLEAHATAVRELEGRLGASLTRPPHAACAAAPPRQGLDPTDEDQVGELTPVMIDLAALALACNLTRVVTFQFGPCGHAWRCKWLDVNLDSHGVLAHGDFGQDPTITAHRVTIGRWHAQMVARMARALADLPDGAGTALDSSLLVWSNENATGYHAVEDLPVVMIGGAGGRLPAGGRVVNQGKQPHHRVGATVMRLMGVDTNGFGDRPDCGPLRGVFV